jgi:hypothetical protein
MFLIVDIIAYYIGEVVLSFLTLGRREIRRNIGDYPWDRRAKQSVLVGYIVVSVPILVFIFYSISQFGIYVR